MDNKLKKGFRVISKDGSKAKIEITYDDNTSEIDEYTIVHPSRFIPRYGVSPNTALKKIYFDGFSCEKIGLGKNYIIENFNAEGSIFDGFSNFSGMRFIGSVSFSNVMFGDGGVNFGRARFEGGPVTFEGTLFGNGGVSFKDASFGEGAVSFRGATFGEGWVTFEDVDFGKGPISFRDVRFDKGDVSFSHAVFGEGSVDFDDVNFAEGKTLFKETKFGDGDVSFQHAKFGDGETSFRWASFGKGDVFFDQAHFGEGDICFNTANFGEGKVSFASSAFSKGTVSFGYSKFGDGDVSFNNVVFGEGDVTFEHVKYGEGEVSFTSAIFSEGKVCFDYATFGEGDVSFTYAEFNNGEVSFINTIFGEGNVLFKGAKIRDTKLLFDNSSFASSIDRKIIFSELETDDMSNGTIYFMNCVILVSIVLFTKSITEVSFENCTISGVIDLSTVGNENISHLRFINLHNSGAVYMNFDKLKKSLEVSSTEYSEDILADEMKMLKENFHNQGYYDWEDEAYVMYMHHHCNTLSQPKKIVLHVFGMIGGYGTKPLRVFLWMLGVVSLFGLLYMAMGPQSISDNINSYHVWSPFYYSMITFLTVGYGDLAARTVWTAILAGLEGFLGVFLMSYFSVSLVRKTLR